MMDGSNLPTARALTDEEIAERADAAHNVDRAVRSALSEGRTAMWRAAEALYLFDEIRGWSALGYESLSEYLADPEIGLSRAVYYRLTAAWRELAVVRQLTAGDLDALDVSKVDVILPALKAGKVTTQEALDDVRELGFRDLRERYVKGVNPGTPDPHDDEDIDTAPPVVENPTDDVPGFAADVDVPDAEVVEDAEDVEAPDLDEDEDEIPAPADLPVADAEEMEQPPASLISALDGALATQDPRQMGTALRRVRIWIKVNHGV